MRRKKNENHLLMNELSLLIIVLCEIIIVRYRCALRGLFG